MGKENYKRLGDYIVSVKNKNKDLKATKLLGINIDKFFMPSVANIIGTDMSRYKVVGKYQFACNRMHVGRDYRIPVALSKSDEVFMVSPAYDVFEIVDANILNPEYLMMWFSRKEFDRNAWFYTDADVRGGLSWKAFCDMQLPIPTIEKQQAIVKEYNTIVNRIKLNEQLNKKLEDTAQTLYKHWFVDFEFPNEDGKPYKSFGGKMVFNEVLEKEIPEGWKVDSIINFCKEVKSGGTPSRGNIDYWNKLDIPWLKTGEISNNIIIEVEEYISELGYRSSSAKLLPENTVLLAMYGATAAQVAYLKVKTTTNQACCGLICKSINDSAFLYYYFISNQSEIANMAIGGAQPNLSKNLIENLPIILAPSSFRENRKFASLLNNKELYTREVSVLNKIKHLVLSKMTKI